MDIDVRSLRSFVAIYEKGSLTRAAELLACTQAAMSMRLKLLETELGEPLFLRQHHRLEPTFRATEFYAKALTVLAAYDEMISSSRSRAPRSKLRLGVPDDYALGILPRALAAVQRGPRPIEIEVTCDLSANLAAALNRKDVDLALVTLAAQPASALASVEVGLRWVHDPGFAPRAGEPIGLAAYPEGCVFRRAMIAALEEAGMPWAVVAQSRNHAGIVAALRGGMGVSAMAAGTAPAGLIETEETAWLPRLSPVPICLLGPAGHQSPDLAALVAAISGELERMAVTAAVQP